MMSEGWVRSGGTELDVLPGHTRLHSNTTNTHNYALILRIASRLNDLLTSSQRAVDGTCRCSGICRDRKVFFFVVVSGASSCVFLFDLLSVMSLLQDLCPHSTLETSHTSTSPAMTWCRTPTSITNMFLTLSPYPALRYTLTHTFWTYVRSLIARFHHRNYFRFPSGT